jgi:hypothetical protein
MGSRIYAAGKPDKGRVIQVPHSELRLFGKGMPFRRGEHNPVLGYRQLIQFLAQSAHPDYETGIQSARADGFRLLDGQHGNGCQFSVRLFLSEPAKTFRNDAVPGNGLYKTHPKGSRPAPCHALGAPRGLLNFTQDSSRILQEQLSCGAQSNAAREAVEQRKPDFFLQILYLAGKRRLCHVEPLGRPTEMLLLTHSHKVTQMPQFHIDTSQASEL